MTQPVVTFDPKVSSALSELRYTLMMSCVPNVPAAVQDTVHSGRGASALLEPGGTASHSHSANLGKPSLSDSLFQQMLQGQDNNTLN